MVFDLFELVWKHKALTRLAWIGLDPQLSDPFGLKVGTQQSLLAYPESRIVEEITQTLIRLVWTRESLRISDRLASTGLMTLQPKDQSSI